MRGRLAFRILIFSVGSLFCSAHLQAADPFTVYRSSPALARGNTGLTTSEGLESVFYNPATLAAHPGDEPREQFILLSPAPEVSTNVSKIIKKVSSKADSDKISVVQDLKDHPFSAGVSNFSGVVSDNVAVGWIASGFTRAFSFLDPNRSGLETIDLKAYSNLGLVGTYSHELPVDGLFLGTTLKYISRSQITAALNLSDVKKIQNLKISNYRNFGTGVGADLGALYRMGLKDSILLPQFALTIDDIGNTTFKKDKDNPSPLEPLRQTVNLGASVGLVLGKHVFTVQGDFRDFFGREETNSLKRLHLGLDYSFHKKFGLGVGLNQGYPSAGLFLGGDTMRLDVGTYGEELGVRVGQRADIRYFIRLMVSV